MMKGWLMAMAVVAGGGLAAVVWGLSRIECPACDGEAVHYRCNLCGAGGVW